MANELRNLKAEVYQGNVVALSWELPSPIGDFFDASHIIITGERIESGIPVLDFSIRIPAFQKEKLIVTTANKYKITFYRLVDGGISGPYQVLEVDPTQPTQQGEVPLIIKENSNLFGNTNDPINWLGETGNKITSGSPEGIIATTMQPNISSLKYNIASNSFDGNIEVIFGKPFVSLNPGAFVEGLDNPSFVPFTENLIITEDVLDDTIGTFANSIQTKVPEGNPAFPLIKPTVTENLIPDVAMWFIEKTFYITIALTMPYQIDGDSAARTNITNQVTFKTTLNTDTLTFSPLEQTLNFGEGIVFNVDGSPLETDFDLFKMIPRKGNAGINNQIGDTFFEVDYYIPTLYGYQSSSLEPYKPDMDSLGLPPYFIYTLTSYPLHIKALHTNGNITGYQLVEPMLPGILIDDNTSLTNTVTVFTEDFILDFMYQASTYNYISLKNATFLQVEDDTFFYRSSYQFSSNIQMVTMYGVDDAVVEYFNTAFGTDFNNTPEFNTWINDISKKNLINLSKSINGAWVTNPLPQDLNAIFGEFDYFTNDPQYYLIETFNNQLVALINNAGVSINKLYDIVLVFNKDNNVWEKYTLNNPNMGTLGYSPKNLIKTGYTVQNEAYDLLLLPGDNLFGNTNAQVLFSYPHQFKNAGVDVRQSNIIDSYGFNWTPYNTIDGTQSRYWVLDQGKKAPLELTTGGRGYFRINNGGIKFKTVDYNSAPHSETGRITRQGVGVDKDGKLYVWGTSNNFIGLNGLYAGSSDEDITEPTHILIDKTFNSAVISKTAALALDTSGHLWAWGSIALTDTTDLVFDVEPGDSDFIQTTGATAIALNPDVKFKKIYAPSSKQANTFIAISDTDDLYIKGIDLLADTVKDLTKVDLGSDKVLDVSYASDIITTNEDDDVVGMTVLTTSGKLLALGDMYCEGLEPYSELTEIESGVTAARLSDFMAIDHRRNFPVLMFIKENKLWVSNRLIPNEDDNPMTEAIFVNLESEAPIPVSLPYKSIAVISSKGVVYLPYNFGGGFSLESINTILNYVETPESGSLVRVFGGSFDYDLPTPVVKDGNIAVDGVGEDPYDFGIGDWVVHVPPITSPNEVITISNPEDETIAEIPFPPGYNENSIINYIKDGNKLILIIDGKIVWEYELSPEEMWYFNESNIYIGFYVPGTKTPTTPPGNGSIVDTGLTYFLNTVQERIYINEVGLRAKMKYGVSVTILSENEVYVGDTDIPEYIRDAWFYVRGGVEDQGQYNIPWAVAYILIKNGYENMLTPILTPPVDPEEAIKKAKINNSLASTVAAVNFYINDTPEGPFDLATFQALAVTIPPVNINMSFISGNVLRIVSSITGFTYTATQNINVPEPVDPEEAIKKAKIDNSLANTVTAVNNYITSNPDGPFELATFESLAVEESPVVITMSIVGNVLNINSSIVGFDYTAEEDINIPEIEPTDPFASGSIFWYPLQDNANDISNGFIGTNNGVTFVTDNPYTPGGKSASFDGLSFIQLPAFNPDFSGGFTWSTFIKFNNISEYDAITDFSRGPDNYNILISPYTGTNVSHLVFNGSSPTSLFATGFYPVTNIWYMLTVTISPSGLTSFYVDGQYWGSISGVIPTQIERTHNFIGAQSYSYEGSIGLLHGNMAHLRMWNTELSDTQVAELYTYLMGL